MRTSKTIFAAIAAAPLLALGGGLAYANTGGTPPAPAVTTATTARTATPAPAPGTGQHPAVGTCRNGTWHYNGGRWCCDTRTGYQNPAAQHRATQPKVTRVQVTRGSGYQGGGDQGNGYQGGGLRDCYQGHGDDCGW